MRKTCLLQRRSAGARWGLHLRPATAHPGSFDTIVLTSQNDSRTVGTQREFTPGCRRRLRQGQVSVPSWSGGPKTRLFRCGVTLSLVASREALLHRQYDWHKLLPQCDQAAGSRRSSPGQRSRFYPENCSGMSCADRGTATQDRGREDVSQDLEAWGISTFHPRAVRLSSPSSQFGRLAEGEGASRQWQVPQRQKRLFLVPLRGVRVEVIGALRGWRPDSAHRVNAGAGR